MTRKIAFVLSALMAALGLPAGGCGNDACTRADDQLAACSPQSITVTPPSESLACTPKRMCQADCINSHPCADINPAFCIGQTLCPPAPKAGTLAFAKCMADCQGQ